MNWARVKTILIILFLGINVFLLINMMISVDRTITIKTDTVEDTVEVLKKNDVIVDKQLIPTKMRSMRRLNMQNTELDPDMFAQKILGAGYDKVLEGEVHKYTLGTKALTINGSKFSYTNTSPSMGFADLNDNTVEGHSKKLFERFKLDFKYAVLENIQQNGNGRYSVRFVQKFQGKEIYGCYIMMDIAPQGLYAMEGYWLMPESFVSAPQPVRHVTGILIDFVGDVEKANNQPNTIIEISSGYYIDTEMVSLNIKTVEARPVWRIKTDSGHVYYYDAITGDYVTHKL